MPKITKQTNVPITKPPTPTSKSSSEDVSAWGAADSLRVLLYGQSGTGKTTLWATFPSPILCLICSGGSRPGELRSIDTPANRKRIVPRIVNSMEDLEAYFKEASNYATVVLDHASGLSDLYIKEMLGVDQVPISKYRRAGKGESWSLVSQQQYGQLAVKLKETFRDMLNLPCNVVIVSQERVFGGKDDGLDPDLIKPTVGAALTPSVVGWLNPACDYVLQTFKRPRTDLIETKVGDTVIKTRQRVKGVEYCVRCEPHDVFMTKFRVPLERIGSIPDVIVDPTYAKLMAVISGEGEG